MRDIGPSSFLCLDTLTLCKYTPTGGFIPPQSCLHLPEACSGLEPLSRVLLPIQGNGPCGQRESV